MTKILVSGICGFVGSSLARYFVEHQSGIEVSGFDNFIRAGSELNRRALRDLGIAVTHADLRAPSDIDALPPADWLIDAAANASVLAGVDGNTSSRQIIEHNLLGTVQLLEYCKAHKAGFILLSSSRVYSIPLLASLPMNVQDVAFVLDRNANLPVGVTANGITEDFSTEPPASLYGTTKLCSERLALEYGDAFGFPIWINRCGVLAGAGQFGRADQGIFSFWINSWLRHQSLRYIGFGGSGYQVRDALHPHDVARLILAQIHDPNREAKRVQNVAGGVAQAVSLKQLSAWCGRRFGPHDVASDAMERPFDIPWMIMDSSRAASQWGWRPEISLEAILDEIAIHATQHPDWLAISS
ncbi:MAG TPA: NAD-dependent epimerase/dehydratase family protein [Chthoniobacteraceae bacterium]|nr:NAD-dependent epimerase/dehydratase family protein [Chthoniobacteraceae bacterium]